METWVWIVIAAVAAVVVLGVLWGAARTRRTRSLQERFGREYDRTVDHAGDRREAERELREREKRHEELELRPLAPEARDRYVRGLARRRRVALSTIQRAPVKDADRLVQRVMRDRGYPVGRLRAAGGRHLGRASGARREVPYCARDRAGERARRGLDGGSPPLGAPLPGALRRVARGPGWRRRRGRGRKTAKQGQRRAASIVPSRATARIRAVALDWSARSARSSAPCSAMGRTRGRSGVRVRRPTSARAASSGRPFLSSEADAGPYARWNDQSICRPP